MINITSSCSKASPGGLSGETRTTIYVGIVLHTGVVFQNRILIFDHCLQMCLMCEITTSHLQKIWIFDDVPVYPGIRTIDIEIWAHLKNMNMKTYQPTYM